MFSILIHIVCIILIAIEQRTGSCYQQSGFQSQVCDLRHTAQLTTFVGNHSRKIFQTFVQQIYNVLHYLIYRFTFLSHFFRSSRNREIVISNHDRTVHSEQTEMIICFQEFHFGKPSLPHGRSQISYFAHV